MSQSFGMIEIFGHDKLARDFSVMRHNVSIETDKALEDAADYFIQQAILHAPREKGRVHDSIGKLEAVGEANVSFSSVYAGSHNVVVGVDMKHQPATRAEFVGQYAIPMNDKFRYIDSATLDVEKYIKERMNAVVAKATKPFLSRVGGRIAGAARSLWGRFKGFFGR